MERLLNIRGEKGFTLIELLVVIAILAVLAAVAIPAYSRFFDGGEAEANAAELSHLQNAMDAMLLDNRINTVVPQPDPTSDFSGLPAGDSTEFLFPAFLRSKNTKCTYTWQADAFLIQAGCNQGGSAAPPSLEGLKGQVTALVDLNVLDSTQAQPLLVKLDAALLAVEVGSPTEAIVALTDFINQVNADVTTGKLSDVQAQPLIDTAEALLQEF